MLSFNAYLDMQSVEAISPGLEINEYKLLNIRSLDFMDAFMKLVTFCYLVFHNLYNKTSNNLFFELKKKRPRTFYQW